MGDTRKNAAQSALRRSRIANGWCRDCGAHELLLGHVTCRACAEKRTRYAKNFYTKTRGDYKRGPARGTAGYGMPGKRGIVIVMPDEMFACISQHAHQRRLSFAAFAVQLLENGLTDEGIGYEILLASDK